jgi:hypothetical protein
MTFDKGKSKMEKFEYICKINARHEDFFEKESMEEVEKYAEVCKKVEEITLEEKNAPKVHERRSLEVVIGKIIECSKPIVGHFPNLDIGLIYQAFIGELP